MIDPTIRARFRRKLRDGTASPLTLAQIHQAAIEAGWAGDAGGRGAPVAINWAFLERLREGQCDG